MPRVHTPLNDAPSKGQELIDFADQLFEHGFMEWQKNLAIHSCKVKPDGRWLHPIFNATVARQNGKSTYMNARILMGLFEWDEPLQILSSHRLQTSLDGWIIGRRASGQAVCAAVATALATHFATRPEVEIDILAM